MRSTRFAILIPLLAASAFAADPASKTFRANDTFINPRDAKPETQQALDDLKWKPGEFDVTCIAVPADGPRADAAIAAGYDATVTFPSPWANGDALNDTVTMEWFAARDETGKPKRAPAVVVLHILQNDPLVPRLFARAFAKEGIHAFVMYMPNYGPRRRPGLKPSAKVVMEGVRQAIADARRARDAVAALPNIEPGRIGIQGTSLGGFICTAAAALDDGFNVAIPTLAGADLPSMFEKGRFEVAKLREGIAKAGIAEEDFKAMLRKLDPLLVAHRLDPRRTFLFNADADEVIPPANAKALAKAANIKPEQHIWMSGGHVTCVLHLPKVLPIMIQAIKDAKPRGGP